MTVDDPSRRNRLAQHYIAPSPSPRLQEAVALAACALGFPMAQVNILDDSTQYTIGDYRAGGVSAVPRAHSMCAHTVAGNDVVAVDDLRSDPRSKDLPGVLSGAAASYLGVPLHSREATPVGTLCVFDTEPRVITSRQIEVIRQFGHIVEDRLELERRAGEHQLAGPLVVDGLAEAIEGDRIMAWFQPVVDLHSDDVVGYEALARWQHVDGRIRSPEEFIRLAEDSDLIVDLDRAVMRRALAQLARWQRTRPDLRLAINASTRHLELADGASFIHAAVCDAGVGPASVVIELTETRELVDTDAARTAVGQLRGWGYDVVLDDFGSGWSSLDWVLGLPINGIKIDRAVTTALGSPAGDAITSALAALTRELNLTVVVEGIATHTQAEVARGLGFQHGQGYLWGPPLPAA